MSSVERSWPGDSHEIAHEVGEAFMRRSPSANASSRRPWVMSTEEEILQAFAGLEAGRFGPTRA
jgi:hypothetical protein